MKISETIAHFLAQVDSPHVDHFHPGLELQIDPVNEEVFNASDWVDRPFPIRLPKNGSTTPVENDRDMPYPIELAERFGTSGWNYREQRSEFVVFDFDSRNGHAGGLIDDELRQLQDEVSELDYVQVHRSKGGYGFHFYVHLEGHVPAATRREHRLVSKAVIAQMSQDAGVEFSAKSDCEGAQETAEAVWKAMESIDGVNKIVNTSLTPVHNQETEEAANP